MIYTFLEHAFTTENCFVFKQRCKAIAKVTRRLLAFSRAYRGTVVLVCIAWRVWILENLRITMQRNDQMSYAERLDHLDHDGAANNVPGCILAMGVVGLYVEVGKVARFRLEGIA
jgi:hypothetical protein